LSVTIPTGWTLVILIAANAGESGFPPCARAHVVDGLLLTEEGLGRAGGVRTRRDREGTARHGLARSTVLHRMGPWKVPTTEEVVELNPPRQFTNRGVSGPLAGVARCTVEPLNGGRRSRLTITLKIEARGLGKLLRPFARRRARKVLPKQLKKLKAILDGGVMAEGRQEPSARA
jgi:hypothetical protein